MSASPFDRYKHFSELNEPLDTQAGVLSPSDRKAAARENLGVDGAGTTLAAYTTANEHVSWAEGATLQSVLEAIADELDTLIEAASA